MSMIHEEILNNERIEELAANVIDDFNATLSNLRKVMRVIEKTTITLTTLQPLGPKHNSRDGEYHLVVDRGTVRFIDNIGVAHLVDDNYLAVCSWFQVYVYTVEMEMTLHSINNHIKDCVELRDSLGSKDK
jgi:hypothetical protein